MKHLKSSLLFAAGLGLGVVATHFTESLLVEKSTKPRRGEIHSGQKGFINPLIDCPSSPEGTTPNKAALKNQVQRLISEAEASKGIETVGVFFRDLNNGPTFELNTTETFIAASLMKIPVAVGFLKRAMSEPSLLKKEIVYDPKILSGTPIYSQTIPVGERILEGKAYTVEELLKKSVMNSDNLAVMLLGLSFPEISPIPVLKEMGVPFTITDDGGYVTVDDYAAVFRILYNASYLDQEKSSLLLEWLSQSNFNDGLVAGLPRGVTISHKFGERQLPNMQQFHHCGIVYYPARPYLLCVMTRGTQQKDLIDTIAKISRQVYDQIDQDAGHH